MMCAVRRLLAGILLCVLMTVSCAGADNSLMVFSQGWNWDEITNVQVQLKADVKAHMPYDDDRLSTLIPLTDLMTLQLYAGKDAGSVTVSVADQPVLTLRQRGHEVQLSSMPDITFEGSDEIAAMDLLLGGQATDVNLYEMLGLAPEGETLITDGSALLQALPAALNEYGRRSESETNITGIGRAAYRYDYTIPGESAEALKTILLTHCPDGWLYEIIDSFTFSGKQTLRIYYSRNDTMLRAEYNGNCGAGEDLRKVTLIYKARHDEEMDKDIIELTAPAVSGSNKHSLRFERVMETNSKGERVVEGGYDYTVVLDKVTSQWDGEFALNNAYSVVSDVITGSVMIRSRLNDADAYHTRIIEPELVLMGSEAAPQLRGVLSITEKYSGKVTEQAQLHIDLHPSSAMAWQDTETMVHLASCTNEELDQLRMNAAASIAEALVIPLIRELGESAEWFFRDLPPETVQTMIEAAGAADQVKEAEH